MLYRLDVSPPRFTLNARLCTCIAASLLLPLAPTARGAAPEPSPAPKTSTNTVEQLTDGKPLFDGKTLKGWKITDFAGHGEVTVDPAFRLDAKASPAPAIIMDMGAVLTGLTWINPPPKASTKSARSSPSSMGAISSAP